MPNKPDRNEILNAMQLKDSVELLQIWQENDHVSWHDEVFDVIREILEERDEILPEQNEAIIEESQREKKKKKKKLIKQENINFTNLFVGEDQPVFYNPRQVLEYVSKLKYIAYALIFSSILSTLLIIPQYTNYFLFSFSTNKFQEIMISAGVVIVFLFALVVQVAFIFYFIRLFGKIILILMEMEFTSRRK